MRINMSMHDTETGRFTEITQTDIEYLRDVAEVFLSFLQGAGYSYVNQVIVVKDDGDEVATVK